MSTSPQQAVYLPLLREDLQLLKGPADLDGSPTWNIYDPVCNSYFRIGWAAFQILSRWNVGTLNGVLDKVSNETTAKIDEEDVNAVITFLHANNLTRDSASGSSNDYLLQVEATQTSWYKWLVKNYLFMRIPLCRPHRFLNRTMPLIEPLYSKKVYLTMIVLGLVGLYLVARQWEVFIGTFLYFFNAKGAVFYFLALVFIKVMHELGHAYTATRYGSKVASMGVALMVMMPVLYSDTTDAWRLNSRKQRLHIGAAGMFVELYLAVIFTLLWSFLPDGLMRSAAFVMATTSWIMSLAINLNILMRFDGYYILSDLLGVENLQDRSFALGKWRLRELLFDLGLPSPGKFPPLIRRKLIIYAWGVWIYRFFLFLGIALLVYHFFFKLLGVLLFIVEIMWFIVLPIVKEVKMWREMKLQIRESQRYRLVTVLGFIILSLFFIPWNTRITTPAIMHAESKAVIHSLSPGVIKKVLVHEGEMVEKEQALLVLDSPSLEDEIARTLRQQELAELRSQRRASNLADLANMQVTLQQLQELDSRLNGLYKLREELTVRAPITGTLVDTEDNLHPGRWINSSMRIGQIAQLDTVTVQGVIEGRKLDQVGIDQTAVFIPNEPELDIVDTKVVQIEDANMQTIESLYFASTYGGEIAVRENDDKELVPETSIYKIRFKPDGIDKVIPRVVKGIIHIQGEPRSFAFRTYDLVATVLIRETGF
ncbi:MAG: biotin/lipoyl-binding protein [Gammaproteobacteria bacterium]|nr:biotin/lipoyl-binding protein [Gammaproteobacteria bacterium]